jgi:cell division protein FtsQ
MKSINWKLIGVITLWIVGLSAVISSFAFTEIKQRSVLCKSILIDINRDDENYFINKADVLKILYSTGDSLIGTKVDEIPLSLLERLIVANKYIKSAKVFIDIKGNLQVEINQRKPLIRIINSTYQSFYIDEDGNKMPLSTLYSARSIICNGNILESYDGKNDTLQTALVSSLYALSKFIKANEFWEAQIEQIYIEQNNDFVFIPRVGDHKIIFGDTTNMVEKFDNLMIFYNKALPKVGWQTYHTINVKYKGQIVASRNDIAEPVLQVLTDSLETAIDSTESKININ